MTVDRGGLRYPIAVVDEFSKNLQSFRDQVRRARAEMAGFRRSTLRTSTDLQKGLKSTLQTQKEVVQAREKAARSLEKIESRERTKRLGSIEDAAKAQEKADTQRAKRLNALLKQQEKRQRTAGRLFTDAKKARVKEVADIERVANAERAAEAARLKAGLTGVRNQTIFRNEMEKTESAANRISFTFRRLFGILAAFTIARQAGQAFVGLIRGAFEFNQQMEASRIGLAGIIAGSGKLTNAQGEVAKGAEEFNLSMGAARKQQAALQKDALRTSATYKELLDVFQVAVGPGLAAQLNLDQIRQVAVLVSQAASAIGQDQNQLSEEIRSLLTGSISARSSRIAQVLGITNEDIREAKATGDLFKLLRGRLETYNTAAEVAANTTGNLARRIGDVFQIASGAASKETFDALGATLRGIFESIVVIERDGKGAIKSIAPSPQLVDALKEVFDAIGGIVDAAKGAADTAGFESLQGAAAGFASILEFVGILIVDIVAGAIRGFSTLQSILGGIGSVFESVFGAGSGVAREILRTIVQIVTVSIGLQIAFNTVFGTLGKMVALYGGKFLPLVAKGLFRMLSMSVVMGDILTKTGLAAKAMGVLRSHSLLVAGAIGVALFGMTSLLSSILGVDVGFKDLGEVLGNSFEHAFTLGIAHAENFATRLILSVKGAARKAKSFLKEAYRDAQEAVAVATDDNETLIRLGAEREKDLKAIADAEAEAEGILKAAQDKFVQQIADADAKAGERLEKLRTSIADRQKELERLNEGIASGGKPKEKEAEDPIVAPRDEEIGRQEKDALQARERQLAFTRLEVSERRRLVAIRNQELGSAVEAVRISDVEIGALRAKLNLVQAMAAEDIARFQRDNDERLKLAKGDEARNFAQKEFNLLKAEQAAKEQEIRDLIAEQEKARERQRLVVEGTVGQGATTGINEWVQQFSSQFQAGINIAKGAMNEFSSFVSDALTDALDPNSDTTIKDRFAQFLGAIGKLIIAELTKVAVAKLLAQAGFGAAAEGGEVVGRAKGGPIPRRAQASAHHMRARGYAGGGNIAKAARPKGLDPRDTVPIWAQPGEWMMKLKAVRTYGLDMMHAINEGAIDPSALRALAGSKKMGRTRKVRRLGYAEGGAIETARSVANSVSSEVEKAGGGDRVLPVLVADNQSFGRMLSGGKAAFMDFLGENAADIDGVLGRNRR